VTRWSVRTAALPTAVALAFTASAVAAQNPDLGLTKAERDSILAHYHQIFPIGGRQAVERGYDLPAPLGFNLGIFSMTQDLVISNLGIGFNKPAQPVDFITFESASARVDNYNARVDLWVLPVLNVYVIGGYGDGQTKIQLAEPVPIHTTAEFKGSNIGVGVTGVYGYRRAFVVADYNHQWAFSSLLNAPVPADIFSARLGRSFRVGERQKRIKGTFWVGTMLQSLKAETDGSIALADVLEPGADSLFTNYQQSDWYQALRPPGKALVDEFVQRLGGGLDTTVVNYRLDKKPADPWNMLVGGTFDFGVHWGVRYEVGFIGRTSWLLLGNYRIRI
jgi:hypothetical protein